MLLQETSCHVMVAWASWLFFLCAMSAIGTEIKLQQNTIMFPFFPWREIRGKHFIREMCVKHFNFPKR